MGQSKMKRYLPAHPLPLTWEPYVRIKVGQVYWKEFRKVGKPFIIHDDGIITEL